MNSVRRYIKGGEAGKKAAANVLREAPRLGGNWQHPMLDRIHNDDNELRGWIVGYLNTLECLAMADGHRI